MALKNLLILSVLILISALIGCSSTKNTEPTSADELFNTGLELFNDEDYIEARKYFETIRLQYPASQYADDAQFYLASVEYAMEEYIVAAFNFNRLRSLHPSSEYNKESLFKAAMCYYELSPTYDRDQDYTKKAIEAFNTYQRFYPNDNSYSAADKYIKELREKLAEREYSTAILYTKMGYPRSSLIYFESVINDYSDTGFYEAAYYGKIDILTVMGRFDEAKGLIDIFKNLFPVSKYSSDLKAIEEQIKSTEE